jgi:hypothetical protein
MKAKTMAIIGLLLSLSGAILSVYAAVLTLDLQPGDTGILTCEAGELTNITPEPQLIQADCIALATATETAVPTATITHTHTPTATPVPTFTSPYPDAPPCLEHDNDTFHNLWNSAQGCHYDHEHGENPFVPEVAAVFPDFDLTTLLGNVEIGHTNPSSPMENTHKHGGFKWQVQTATPLGCDIGFNGSEVGVNAAVIQYHGFGDYSIEFESRVHSALALVRQCLPGDLTDYGYAHIVQHIDYGQRLSPYQGTILPYPDTPNPAYAAHLAPYLTLDCAGTGLPGCRPSREWVLSRNANASSIWSSRGAWRVAGSELLTILFRVRDNYQVLDSSDLTHPFTFTWLCSGDSGLSYSALAGCRYNNSTTRVHEVAGTIPASWDNLAGFDTNPTAGRITAEGFVTHFGNLNTACTTPGPDCHPIKLVDAFVGVYGTSLIPEGVPVFTAPHLPERDIYFCGEQVCAEGVPGAVSSGWIGAGN